MGRSEHNSLTSRAPHKSHTQTQLPSPPVEEPAAAGEAMEVEGAEGGAAAAAGAGTKAAGKPKPPLYLPETTVYLVMLAVTSALRLGRQDLATELVTALVGASR